MDRHQRYVSSCHPKEAANLVEPLLFQAGNLGGENPLSKGRVVRGNNFKAKEIAVGEILPFGQIKYVCIYTYIYIYVYRYFCDS